MAEKFNCILIAQSQNKTKKIDDTFWSLSDFFLFNFVEIFFYGVEFFVKLPVSFKDS